MHYAVFVANIGACVNRGVTVRAEILEAVHVQWMLASVDCLHIIPDGVIEWLLEAAVSDELRREVADLYKKIN